MPRRKRSNMDIRQEKEALYADLGRGVLTLGQATRRMRKIIGITQADYATKILKIYPRVLLDLENDRGNPTLETLEKVAKPFGLKVAFVKEKPEHIENQKPEHIDVRQDDQRINIHERWERRYWTTELGVSEQELEDLVHQYGASVKEIRNHVGNK